VFALRARPRLVILTATLIAYSTSLGGPFQFDDTGVIVDSAAVHALGTFWSQLGVGLRPVLKLSYALNWALSPHPFGFHVVNLGVHLVNVELVLRLYTAGSSRAARWPFAGCPRGAPLAAFLFALHPIQTEAVTYVSGRSVSLETLFVLLATLLYVEGVRGERPSFWAGLAPLAFAAALLTKETAATLPLALLAWELIFERPRVRALCVRQGVWWSFLGFAFVWAVTKTRYFELLYDALGRRSFAAAVAFEVQGLSYVLTRLVLIFRLCIDPGLGQRAPAGFFVACAGGAILGCLLLMLSQVRARPLVAFGAAWFGIELVLPNLCLPRTDVMNERHLYLANVGVFLAGGALWAELGSKLPGRIQKLGVATVTLTLTVLGIATFLRNLDYESEVRLWESTTLRAPRNPRAQNNLGVAYEKAGRPRDALTAYAHALELEPRYLQARQNLLRAERKLRSARASGAAPAH
jgi:hypothetical protein